MPELTLGHPAPKLKLTTLDGNEFDLQAHHGQSVVLAFFKSDCPWSQMEMPRLAKVFAHVKSQGIQVPVLGVVVGTDTSESASNFAQTCALDIPLVVDTAKTIRADFALTRVPSVILVDAKGNISRIYEGATEQLGGIVEQTILAAAHGNTPPNYNMIGNGCSPD